MRYIKLLSMFVILAVALLLISTIRTYAGFGGDAAAIIVCDGNLLVVKTDITDTGDDCCTGSYCDCQVGDRCDECLEACIDLGYSSDFEFSGPGKITYTLTAGGGG